ncbi:MAG: hypothetical protein OEY44_03925 [Candidatus Peregrinibacteria bacterium]|nr:hypothetical protein [Candidatus Peregrinibacteria bacterium]
MPETPSLTPEEIESQEIYATYDCLKKHQEYLGLLSHADILGVGTQAIVVRSLRHNAVLKIPLSESQEKWMEEEFKLHDRFRSVLLKGVKERVLSGVVKVPKISFEKTESGSMYLSMDRVDGQSLLTHHLKESYQ